MGLADQVVNEVGRLFNRTNHPEQFQIGHLAVAAARAAESLVYLVDLDDRRFGGVWPIDAYEHATVDDGHVRWAAAGALTSLDLCIAAAARISGFARNPPRKEDSIRSFYNPAAGLDRRSSIPAPWRVWIDAVVTDLRYDTLVQIRNAVLHSDLLRGTYGTTGSLAGHGLRFDYRGVGAHWAPQRGSNHRARDIVVLSRDVALFHANAFVGVLQGLP